MISKSLPPALNFILTRYLRLQVPRTTPYLRHQHLTPHNTKRACVPRCDPQPEFPTWLAVLTASYSFDREVLAPPFTSLSHDLSRSIFSQCAEYVSLRSISLKYLCVCAFGASEWFGSWHFPTWMNYSPPYFFLPANILSALHEILHTAAWVFFLNSSLVFVAHSFTNCNNSGLLWNQAQLLC